MPNKILILSPHCDDVPLSLGASLCGGQFGASVQVTVVFSRSCYTLRDSVCAKMDTTTRIRNREEREAARMASYRVRFLGYGEPFVRPGFVRHEDIFDPSRRPENDYAWTTVRSTLLGLMRLHKGPILGPLACGGHIDHRIVSACLREFLQRTPDTLCAFYEDLHYAAVLSEDQIHELVPLQSGRESFVPVIARSGSIASKLELLGVYRSQLGENELLRVKSHWERYGGGERIWVPENRPGALMADSPVVVS